MMSSVSKGRDVPSASQLGEVLKVGEGLRIRERIGVLHREPVDCSAHSYLADLSAYCARDRGYGEHDFRYMAR